MNNIIVLGSGMVGSAMAIDLAKKHTVTITDLNQAALDEAYKRCSKLTTLLLDVTDEASLKETIATYERCVDKGIELGAHIILGLPGESREEILNHAKALSKLPIRTLKLHHLQIVKGSVMANQFKKTPEKFDLFELEDYINVVEEFIQSLRPDIIIERFISEAPGNLLIAPKWGLKNFEVVAKIDKHLALTGSFQGKNYKQ